MTIWHKKSQKQTKSDFLDNFLLYGSMCYLNFSISHFATDLNFFFHEKSNCRRSWTKLAYLIEYSNHRNGVLLVNHACTGPFSFSFSVLNFESCPFNWDLLGLISSCEENNCCYKLSNWQNDDYFQSKWQLQQFWVK